MSLTIPYHVLLPPIFSFVNSETSVTWGAISALDGLLSSCLEVEDSLQSSSYHA